MFHLAVYSASIATATANTQVAAVADVGFAPAGSGFLVPPLLNKLAAVYGIGNILNRAQLSSGSLRDRTPFDINPVAVGTVWGSPAPKVDLTDMPIPLVTNEELDAFVSNSAATATQTSVGIILSDGPMLPVRGTFFTVHWTASATLTANAWSSFAITLDNGLPSGTFAIVGSRMKSASALFHRWIPRGGSVWRPGSQSVQAFSAYEFNGMRYGENGEWMRFTNTTPPQCEVFAGAADTSEEGFLDLMQVA